MLLEVVVKLESELFIVTVSHLLIIVLMLAILLRLYWGSVLSESPVWLVNQSAVPVNRRVGDPSWPGEDAIPIILEHHDRSQCHTETHLQRKGEGVRIDVGLL